MKVESDVKDDSRASAQSGLIPFGKFQASFFLPLDPSQAQSTAIDDLTDLMQGRISASLVRNQQPLEGLQPDPHATSTSHDLAWHPTGSDAKCGSTALFVLLLPSILFVLDLRSKQPDLDLIPGLHISSSAVADILSPLLA